MSWSPGTTVGDYRLLERLGAGGMGAVWRVEHRSTGARRALKATLFDDPEALERFQREAHALAALEHPNVARVHTAGEFEGRLYMVLDLAQGGDLEARLARGPLDPEAARALAIELARGLAHVHARGLLHRDLKPSNVLFDEHGRPLLADFGLARALDGSSLTQTGAVLGTPAYMAPEQARAGEPVDERADVYGLGAVLYHALTGAPPFRGGSPIGVLHAVLSQPPTSPRRLNPEVPADLERACLKALAKDPAERFPSARAFAAALRAPAPPGPERHVAVGFVVVALLSAGAAASLALRSPSSPREPAGRDVDALADPERALQPLGDRAKVPEAPDGFPRQVEAASLPHPLDRALARLEPPRPGEFDGCEDLLVQEFLAQLVDVTTGNAALCSCTWLEQQVRV
ncbi:MAG: serine/threonine protein kinase [Planctomycetes bacterium]|nr:serine/threonine protein kinase [Planctomycetota bacterium]